MWLGVTATQLNDKQRIELEPGLTVSSFTRYVLVAPPPPRLPPSADIRYVSPTKKFD